MGWTLGLLSLKSVDSPDIPEIILCLKNVDWVIRPPQGRILSIQSSKLRIFCITVRGAV